MSMALNSAWDPSLASRLHPALISSVSHSCERFIRYLTLRASVWDLPSQQTEVQVKGERPEREKKSDRAWTLYSWGQLDLARDLFCMRTWKRRRRISTDMWMTHCQHRSKDLLLYARPFLACVALLQVSVRCRSWTLMAANVVDPALIELDVHENSTFVAYSARPVDPNMAVPWKRWHLLPTGDNRDPPRLPARSTQVVARAAVE